MSPGPTRQFGGQSRAANSSTGKRRLRSKSPLTRPEYVSRPLIGQEPVEHDPQDDATRSLTPLDLSLAPFKMEQAEDSFIMTEDNSSTTPAGPLSGNFIDEDAMEDVEGMPTRVQWKTIVDSYLASLHPTKRHKSLISQEVYNMIFRTLKSPEATRLGTPQFRFWARKMFQLVEAPSDLLVVTNGGRPVAIKEHIYDILCMCHTECGHGGRDKTCKVLREYYTWVPKELISNFVKVCPTCVPRRITASKARERKVANDISLPKQEESLPGSSRFSVERLEDFGQFPSPLPEDPHQLKLPSLIACSSTPISQHGKFTIVSGGGSFNKSFIPSLSSLACLPQNGVLPLPPWASSSSVILPPLNNGAGNNEDDHLVSDGSRNISLPPLMQFLSQNHDSEDGLQRPRDENFDTRRSPVSYIPIDPSLLSPADRTASFCCSCADSQCSGCAHTLGGHGNNALHLQLHPPTPQDMSRRSVPPPLSLSFARAASTEAGARAFAWEFPSTGSVYGGEGDNSALLSASTASMGLPTPSSSGQISPAGLEYVPSFQYCASDSQSASNFGDVQYTHDQGLAVYLGAEKDSKATTAAAQLTHTGSPPLFSPRPLKIEDTTAMLELAAAASMDEVDAFNEG